MAEYSIIGKSVPRVDALEKVTGRARYNSDFKVARMCYAKLLRSPYPHARILRIDTSRAEKLPGVRAVITGKDAPDNRVGMMVRDQYLLARDVVRFAGEPVAGVVAETLDMAEEAIELIDVDYERLPAVFDPEEAMKQNPTVIVHPDRDRYECIAHLGIMANFLRDRPNVIHTWTIRQGDVEQGFEEADLIIENRYHCPRVHHCQLEPHQADAWVEVDGTLTVRGGKGMYRSLPYLAHCFNLPFSKVRMLEAFLGGDFGGKASPLVGAIAALLAIKSGRPVRLVYTRGEDFIGASGREPMTLYVKDGVKRDGTLIAREIKQIVESGAYSEFVALITRNGCFGAVGTYRVPNFRMDSYGVYTNTPTTQPHRGFGCSQSQWAIEQQMDILAEKLGMDPVEFRKKNFLREGDINVVGEVTHSIGVEECLDKAAGFIEWGKPPEKAIDGVWRRGKGIAAGNKYTIAGSPAGSIVRVHPDGVIEVRHGTDELGQGINTVLSQIAAEEFGVSIDKIKIVFGDTVISPHDGPAGSSRATFHAGNALIRACRDAKRQILEMAAVRLGYPPQSLEIKDGKVGVVGSTKEIKITQLFNPAGYAEVVGEIMGKGFYVSPYVPEDKDGQSPRAVSYYAYGVQAVQVAVNIETGEIRVEKVANCFDMGQPINPKMCEAQMDGGALMGIGHALYEEQLMDGGIMVNPSFSDYKMPTVRESPDTRNVSSMIAAAPLGEGPYFAKGLGESTLTPMAPAIANAVYNAVGVRIKNLPLSREKVLKALRDKESGVAKKT